MIRMMSKSFLHLQTTRAFPDLQKMEEIADVQKLGGIRAG